jgi:hypothetical protein
MVKGVPKRRTLFVEGGAKGRADLNAEARKGFKQLMERACPGRMMPRVEVCGDRRMAFEAFERALQDANPGDLVLLLVDSEAPVNDASPWDHVRERDGDGWRRPAGATDDQLHLMVECMETWLTADRDTLARFYGKLFEVAALPSPGRALERVPKLEIYRCLERATMGTPAGRYGKGSHSFKLLGMLDPDQLRPLPWARRFLEELDRVL